MLKDVANQKTAKGIDERFTLAVYTADLWEHVCPVLRLSGPAQQADFQLIKGNEWQAGALRVYPERLDAADLVVIQRDFPSHVAAYEQVLARVQEQKKPVVYELDDLLPELPDAHPDVVHYIPARSGILKAVVEADAVVGSTPALCDYLRAFNPNAWVLPNYLNDNLWQLRNITASDKEPLVIGYLGGHSHSYDLEVVAPALIRILQRYGNGVLLRFWGVAPPAEMRACHNVDWIDVGLVDYHEFVAYFLEQECDLFIAPLQDNLFNRCKSPLKFLEYSALGVAGIYSRVTPYESVVIHGQNGYLASNETDWERYLVQLIEDPALRVRLASAAQETVRANWMLSQHIHEWSETYQKLAASKGRKIETASALKVANKMHLWQRDLERRVFRQGEQIKELSRQLNALKVQLDGKDQAYRSAYGRYLDIMNSTGWKLMQQLFKIRLKLMPRDSRRERAVKIGIRSARVIRGEGAVAFLRAVARTAIAPLRRDRHRLSGLPGMAGVQTPRNSLEAGVKCPTPALVVAVIKDAAEKGPDEDSVRAWVAEQTFPSVAVAIWDKASGIGYLAEDSNERWPAQNLQAFCRSLPGRYLCLASYDLLDQDETYLEANLVPLEAETLAFTVNLRGNAGWAFGRLEQGYLPGDSLRPLLRQVVDKDYLLNDFSLNLSAWMENQHGFPDLVGKVITHTSNKHDVEAVLPFEGRFPEVDSLVEGRNVLVRTRPDFPWNARVHIIHPIETVLPRVKTPADLPTVLLVTQFLAVGGAEQLALHIMRGLNDKVRFVVLSVDKMDPALGTIAESFRQVTPYVYAMPDFLDDALRGSFINYLIDRFEPVSLYISNGAEWIYQALGEIKQRHPDLRLVNQVYDYEVGWINRYDISLVTYLDGHIGASSKICQAYIAKGARPEQVHLVAHAIDPKELDPGDYPQAKKSEIKRSLGLPPGKKVVTYAARLHPQKRPMDFVELARRFALDQEVVFLMAGDGVLAASVDEQVARLELGNLVRRNFYRPISDLLAISDVVVLPSAYEGMPLIIAEAQVMGKGVVVTDVGNNREVLEITKGGVLVPQVGDVGGLKEGVDKMLADPPDPGLLREAVVSHFGVEVIAGQYYQVLVGTRHA